ncbi:MAG: hypothetical protein ACI9J5_003670 [Paraglaciecola sp.]|jgi:hypothetical protein
MRFFNSVMTERCTNGQRLKLMSSMGCNCISIVP